jgi:hypothetical protein
MPFKSKAQQRFMFAAEERGDVPEGTAERWAKHTPDIKKLPEKKDSEKKAFIQSFVSTFMSKVGEITGATLYTLEKLAAKVDYTGQEWKALYDAARILHPLKEQYPQLKAMHAEESAPAMREFIRAHMDAMKPAMGSAAEVIRGTYKDRPDLLQQAMDTVHEGAHGASMPDAGAPVSTPTPAPIPTPKKPLGGGGAGSSGGGSGGGAGGGSGGSTGAGSEPTPAGWTPKAMAEGLPGITGAAGLGMLGGAALGKALTPSGVEVKNLQKKELLSHYDNAINEVSRRIQSRHGVAV